ncbi:hypothetical protein [Pseudovibrio sp. Ad26]|uniref:hypothetical protein n=1 Tax=Pseudovibrio sp. Ad26 TaxID=989410 RepID=UPI0007B28A28|nr:hypothetical protein [Pseudovibrio sp. Ad26]KZL02644.1 hypothetical protein PsAD26_04725 [Pseudovibrio sp. Ad26]
MQLVPRQRIIDIPTGNKYLGAAELYKHQPFSEVVHYFSRHQMFLKGGLSSSFPTSDIKAPEMHVFYYADGKCKGVEVFNPKGGEDLFWGEVNLFPSSITELRKELIAMGVKVHIGDYGLDVPELGIFTFSAHIEDDLKGEIESIYCSFDVKQ